MAIVNGFYRPDHFALHELVSPGAMEAKGETCWNYFSKEFLITADQLRKIFGPTFLNTWGLPTPELWGKIYRYSGYHLPGEYTRSQWSRHMFFKAGDAKFKDITAKKVREKILGFEPERNGYYENKMKDQFPYITELEIGISWLHFVVNTNVPEGRILCYKP